MLFFYLSFFSAHFDCRIFWIMKFFTLFVVIVFVHCLCVFALAYRVFTIEKFVKTLHTSTKWWETVTTSASLICIYFNKCTNTRIHIHTHALFNWRKIVDFEDDIILIKVKHKKQSKRFGSFLITKWIDLMVRYQSE